VRNPRRWRAIALAAAGLGVAAVAGAFALESRPVDDWVQGALFTSGLTAALFGGAFALWSHLDARAKAALLRGDDVLARWQFAAATWSEFVRLDRAINERGGAPPNDFVPRRIEDATVEVIVGKEAISIDGDIHRLPVHGTPEVTHAELVADRPDYVQLHLLHPPSGGGASGALRPPRPGRLRFPVPAGAWREGRQVVAHFLRLTPQQPGFFHGKGDGTDPEDLNTCIACGYETYQYRSQCPRCGGGMTTRRWCRRFGGMLMACGLFISGLIGTVIYHVAPMLLQPGKSFDGTRFGGTPLQALVVALILAAVMCFGLTALSYGAWQVATGKRSRGVIAVMLAIWTLLLGIAGAI